MNDHKETVQRLTAKFASEPGALLPLLHAVQDALGFIPESEVATIAQGLSLSRAEVHGVITYYHHFRTQAPAKHVVQICLAEACKACGADALMSLAQKTLAPNAPVSSSSLGASHGAAASGSVAAGTQIEPVYCLGLCASSPAMLVDGQLHARVSAEKLHSILNSLEPAP